MKREIAEQRWKDEFEELGLSEYFEFLYRDWSSDKGRKVWLRCKSCEAVFTTWTLNEVRKGRTDSLKCPMCGKCSNGKDLWTRTRTAKEMAEYYTQGHSVRATAEKFGLSIAQVNNYVRVHKMSNGRDWSEAAAEANQKRKEEAERIYFTRWKDTKQYHFVKNGGNPKTRARRHGCRIGEVPSVRKIFDLYGGRCCICGKQCSFDSKEGAGIGKDYPTRGHIVASSKGGDLDIKNLWLVCNECNYTHGQEDETHLLAEGGWTWDEEQKKYVQESTHSTTKR